jgi:hypothetical protein
MTNEGTGAPAEHRPTQPGWVERLSLWGMAVILGIFVNIVVLLALEPLVGRHPARAVATGLGMAVLFEVGHGPRSLRSFLRFAGVCLVAASALEWWDGAG